MPEKDQVLIYNSVELSLIKNTFAENDVLLYALRKVLLGFELTEPEKGLLRVSITDAVYEALKKRILPDLSPVYPLGQIPSIITTLTELLKVKDVEEMKAHFDAKDIEISYLEQRFTVLKDIIENRETTISLIDLKELGEFRGKSPERQYVDTTAYLFLVGYIDPMLIFIKSLAGSKDESIEQQKERLTRNSSK
jgi:hypothetical protein